MTDISLHELLELSIGTEDVGAVNFGALHALLNAILGHLKIEGITTAWRDVDHRNGGGPSQSKAFALDKSSPNAVMEEKVRRMEEQMSLLESLPSASQLLRSDSAVNDMWSLMQLRRKTESNEDGVSKCMALIQELLTEIQILKESREHLTQKVTALHDQISQLNMKELADRIAAMEQYCHQVEDLDNTTKELKEKLTQYPLPEELTQCVTWEVMQAALISERQKIHEGLQNTITISAVKNTAPLHSSDQDTSFKEDTADSSRRVSPPQHTRSDGSLFTGRRLSRVSIGAEQYPETVEALMEVGRLKDRHESLEARVEQLDANKADKSQLQHLSDLLTAMGERQIPDHVPEQLNHLRSLVDSLLSDTEKVSELNTESAGERTGSVSCQETLTSQIKQMTLNISYIRSTVQQLDEKVQKLTREIDDRLEEKSDKERQMQEQLNSLRLMLEDTMKYSSSPVSNSQQLETMGFSKDNRESLGLGLSQIADKTQGLVQVQGQSLGQVQRQTGRQELDQGGGQSYQQYEKQKGMTTPLMNQEHGRSQNTELVSDVQSAILQLQAEYEKLHNTTKHLTEEHSNKQIHIDRLYKTLEELNEKKADKELVEMEIEIKADKRALESKVSRMQFDSMTEQLNNMLQDVLSKMSGQEKDWHKVMEKISTEMDCKLNRIELDPLKKQLDDRWKSIHRQLQTPPAPEQDDAAGIRKQLLARFHCISCDRPVDMMTPGQQLCPLPYAPGLPSHKSSRPYTVYELEQVRQHCRSVRHDLRSPALKYRQIEQESAFPTLRTAEHPGRRTLTELYPRIRPILSPLKSNSQMPKKLDRIPEMADYSYLARSCGGSHTLTYPNRRCTRLQHITHLIQTEEESQHVSSVPHTQAEEVDIMGLDGQVYKGRMNSRAVRATESRLPNISSREGNCKSKDKVSRSQSQRSSGVDTGRGSPVRPQSAKTHHTRSASSSLVRERPMSSMDCLSQPIVLQSSFHDTPTELHKDLNPSEEEPLTSL
ncbi:glutamine-rich protein 2 isoform X2 [Triplophysa dalaica]|uniref:glutamine-rich protein 2 isoform X2 n=1 Tax=Triplophysa dalaica TaxID=1582913 RepID=UPI0024DFD376|nr:glutamine-rich protein 2 isoform X2 [Triplophysa dalaica]